MSRTRIINDSEYPYQVSLPLRYSSNLIILPIKNKDNFDSIYNHAILLKLSKLNDTIRIEMWQYDTINGI